MGFPPNHPPMRSFLGAPVVARGTVFGNIYLTEKQGASEFSEQDEEALVVLASQAGIAIENARLYQEAQRAQRDLARLELLEERERIAKELHDGVIQSLFAVGMGLQGAAAAAEDAAGGHAASRAPSRRSTARSATCATTSSACAPASSPTDTSARHCSSSAQEFQAKTEVVTIVDVDGRRSPRRSPRRRPTSCSSPTRRCRTSAVTQARRRAASRSDARDDDAVLEIDDDGAGFDTDQPRSGMGLANLREPGAGIGGDRSRSRAPGRRHDRPCPAPPVAVSQPGYDTTSAVTMPNMPSGPSTWGRMWQWNAHAPGWSACTSTSNRCPGAITNVSARYG